MDLIFFYHRQLQYQFCITMLIENYVFRLHVSVDHASTVQIGQSFNHTRCVEPGAVVIKIPPETTRMSMNRL